MEQQISKKDAFQVAIEILVVNCKKKYIREDNQCVENVYWLNDDIKYF